MLPDTLDEESSELLPLLDADQHRRPYQAYCVTEASSRPPSPDRLTPSLLRESSVRGGEYRTAQTDIAPETDSKALLDRATTTNPAHDGPLTRSFETGSKYKNSYFPSNRLRSPSNTTSGESNHITQAVTPRGSHSLAPDANLVCNGTLSQPADHQTNVSQKRNFLAIRKRPDEQHNKYVPMDVRPLPPLPRNEDGLLSREFDTVTHSQSRGNCKDEIKKSHGLTQAFPSTSTDMQGEPQAFLPRNGGIGGIGIWTTPAPKLQIPEPSRVKPTLNHRGILFENDPASSRAPTYPTFSSESSRRVIHCNILNDDTQLPSSAELYSNRRSPYEDLDKGQAFRRTIPKDSKLRYQFGERPVLIFDLPPPSPLHTRFRLDERERPSKSVTPHMSSSFKDLPRGTQLGPRPPPWQSFDTLESRRLERGDARERAQALMYRKKLSSSTSLYRGSQSTDSFGRDLMRREVEGYREQVWRIYPDLEFDGSAGTYGRNCCYCIVM